MYYLIINVGGNDRCIDKSPTDIYGAGQQFSCGRNYTYPTNVSKLRNVNIVCSETGNSKTAEVYCDYHTANRLNYI